MLFSESPGFPRDSSSSRNSVFQTPLAIACIALLCLRFGVVKHINVIKHIAASCFAGTGKFPVECIPASATRKASTPVLS